MPESSRSLEKFDVLSKFSISAVGLLLSGAIGFSTVYFTHQANERQANAQIEALSLQKRSSAAQLEQSLLPILSHGRDSERESALSILALIAPDEAERIGNVVIPQLKSETERRAVSHAISSMPDEKREKEYRERVENAAVYRQFALDANACREYFAAYTALSPAQKAGISAAIEAAKKQYARGRFADAATRLQATLPPK